MEPAPYLVTAVDHPSAYGEFQRFLEELHAERSCGGRWVGRVPSASILDRLSAPRTMRMGAWHGGRLIAVAAVDNDGCAAVAVLREFRRRGVAKGLMDVVATRAEALGYPPLHRVIPGVGLAG